MVLMMSYTLYYNHYVSKISQEVTENKTFTAYRCWRLINQLLTYEFEPSEEEILKVLLPQYAESLMYGALLDGKASEHAARMTAMKSATDNAKEVIDSSLHFHLTVHVKQRLRKKLLKSLVEQQPLDSNKNVGLSEADFSK